MHSGSLHLKNSSCLRWFNKKPSPRMLVEKRIFTREEFLEMAKVVDREMKRKRKRVP
jgi:hypothetical protein